MENFIFLFYANKKFAILNNDLSVMAISPLINGQIIKPVKIEKVSEKEIHIHEYDNKSYGIWRFIKKDYGYEYTYYSGRPHEVNNDIDSSKERT